MKRFKSDQHRLKNETVTKSTIYKSNTKSFPADLKSGVLYLC